MVVALRVRVFGVVQRVGFRRYVLGHAQRLGVTGWIRNLPDGSVEVFVQGDAARLEELVKLIGEAPPPIRVERVEKEEAEPDPTLKHFKIIYGELAEELQEGFGAMQTIFMNYWKEFREYREEFRDFRKEFREFRDEFRDYRKEFRDFREEFRDYRKEFREFREEFRDFREEFRNYREEFREFARRSDENFKTILERYGEISERLAEILETLRRDSRETREKLDRSLQILTKLLERIMQEKQK